MPREGSTSGPTNEAKKKVYHSTTSDRSALSNVTVTYMDAMATVAVESP